MNQLKAFFASRPSLSKRGVAKEAGISLTLLKYILKGQRSLTKETKNKLYPVLNKYGFNLKYNKKMEFTVTKSKPGQRPVAHHTIEENTLQKAKQQLAQEYADHLA